MPLSPPNPSYPFAATQQQLSAFLISASGSTLPVQSIKVCVVFDSGSGIIHHHHRVVTLIGGQEPSEQQVATDAITAAQSRSNPPSGALDVLHLAPDALLPGNRYRVDVKSRILSVVD